MIAIASFPRTKAGTIDMLELYRLCAKFNIEFDLIEDLEPWELLVTIEGRLEQQREYFEFLNYSLYNSVAQVLSTKNKKFENPFEKKEVEKKEVPTKEIREHTLDVLADIFGLEKEDNKENGI